MFKQPPLPQPGELWSFRDPNSERYGTVLILCTHPHARADEDLFVYVIWFKGSTLSGCEDSMPKWQWTDSYAVADWRKISG